MLAFRDEQRKELEAHCHCGKQLVRQRAVAAPPQVSSTAPRVRRSCCDRCVSSTCAAQGDYTTINMTMLSAGDPTTSLYNVIPGIAVGGCVVV